MAQGEFSSQDPSRDARGSGVDELRTPSRLHDTRYLGETFRDRQTIQRRQTRLRTRIESLDPIERHEVLQWMQELYGNDEEAA